MYTCAYTCVRKCSCANCPALLWLFNNHKSVIVEPSSFGQVFCVQHARKTRRQVFWRLQAKDLSKTRKFNNYRFVVVEKPRQCWAVVAVNVCANVCAHVCAHMCAHMCAHVCTHTLQLLMPMNSHHYLCRRTTMLQHKLRRVLQDAHVDAHACTRVCMRVCTHAYTHARMHRCPYTGPCTCLYACSA